MHILSRRSRKRKNEIRSKVSDVMIDARARAIDSVILLFYRIYLNSKKLALSVVVVLLKLLLKMRTTNAIRKRFFAH